MSTRSQFWTEDRLTFLVANARVLSAAKLAKQLGCSRNAVIGKSHRLGRILGKPDGRSAEQRRRDRLQHQRERYAKNREKICKLHRDWYRRRKAMPVPVNRPPPKNLSLLDLKLNECHWPVTDEGAPFFYCGHATDDGRSFCPWHHKEAHGYRREYLRSSRN